MKAIHGRHGSGESAVSAVLAGADIILQPRDLDASFTAVSRAVDSGVISEDRLRESVRRILAVKVRRAVATPPSDDPFSIIGSLKHRSVIEELVSRRK